jgi:hypothetical protein
MFGFEKKKIQLRSVEDYLKTQEVLGTAPEQKPPQKRVRLAGTRSFVGPAIGILFILLFVAAALSQFNGLRSEIAAVKTQKADDMKGLELQVADLTTKVDKSEKRVALLADNISRLEKALEAERSERMRAEEATKRSVMAADRAKKTVRHTPPAVPPKAAPIHHKATQP